MSLSHYAGVAELADAQDLKSCCRNTVPVRFPSESLRRYADVAQLAEQLICNQQVIGSSPIIGFFEGTRVLEQGPLAQLVRATGS